MKTKVANSQKQTKVLRFLARHWDADGFGYFPFAPIARGTGLSRRDVRLACRTLARKRLAEFGRGLCNDDGQFVGAGYAATTEGRLHVAGQA